MNQIKLRYQYYYIKLKEPFKNDIDYKKKVYYIKVIRYNYISDPKKYFYNVIYQDINKKDFYMYCGSDRYTKLTKNLENRKYLFRYYEVLEIKKGVLS